MFFTKKIISCKDYPKNQKIPEILSGILSFNQVIFCEKTQLHEIIDSLSDKICTKNLFLKLLEQLLYAYNLSNVKIIQARRAIFIYETLCVHFIKHNPDLLNTINFYRARFCNCRRIIGR